MKAQAISMILLILKQNIPVELLHACTAPFDRQANVQSVVIGRLFLRQII